MNTRRNDLLHRFSGQARRRFARRRLVILIGLALLAPLPTQADTPAERIALLIQNDRYPTAISPSSPMMPRQWPAR